MAHRLLAVAAASAFLVAGTATADDDGWRRRGHDRWDRGWSHDWDHGHGHGHRRHHDDDDDAALLIGGAILGLVVGAALADDGDRGSSYNYGYAPDYGYDYGYTYGQPDYGYSSPSHGYTPAPTYNYSTAPSATYAASTPCAQVRSGRTATGAVIGGVVGGLLGNGVAADKNREEGTAVGAALGSVIGGSLARSSADCASSAGYYQTGYAPPAPAYPSQPSYGYSEPSYSYEDELYGGPSAPGSSSGPAAEECERVMRVTALPDGREIHEPVTVCRQAHFGDWSVQD